MKRYVVFAMAFLVLTCCALALSQSQQKSDEPQSHPKADEVGDRVVNAAVVLKEIMGTPDKSIPQDLLDRCQCVAVIPSMKKAGFILGAAYGKGVISCRGDNGNGPWSAPSMLMMSGGSFGLQIGVQATDLILVVMNLSGVDSLLDSKFTLGADASVAAGPVGRNASAKTDALMRAKILAYSRSRGVFGGLDLNGEVFRTDKDANYVLYKKQLSAKDILFHQVSDIPKDATIFTDELTKVSPKQVK